MSENVLGSNATPEYFHFVVSNNGTDVGNPTDGPPLLRSCRTCFAPRGMGYQPNKKKRKTPPGSNKGKQKTPKKEMPAGEYFQNGSQATPLPSSEVSNISHCISADVFLFLLFDVLTSDRVLQGAMAFSRDPLVKNA